MESSLKSLSEMQCSQYGGLLWYCSFRTILHVTIFRRILESNCIWQWLDRFTELSKFNFKFLWLLSHLVLQRHNVIKLCKSERVSHIHRKPKQFVYYILWQDMVVIKPWRKIVSVKWYDITSRHFYPIK